MRFGRDESGTRRRESLQNSSQPSTFQCFMILMKCFLILHVFGALLYDGAWRDES